MSHGLTTHTIVAASMRPLCSSRRDDEMMPARVSPGAREGQRSRRKEYACGGQISAVSLVELGRGPGLCPACPGQLLSLFAFWLRRRATFAYEDPWTLDREGLAVLAQELRL
jgi:hypothetical protein